MMFVTTGIGLFRYATGSLGVVVAPPHFEVNVLHPITLFLILRAFSNGTTSLTGVEAISNGIMAFKEPRSHNAGTTLVWMSGILGTLLLGITFLAVHIGAVPSEAETVISQLARTVYNGRNFIYVATLLGTTLILVMAANTAFADFPAPQRACRNRWLFASPTGFQGKPPGLFLRHCFAGSDRIRVDLVVQCQCFRIDPALCHRRISLIYTIPGGHVSSLVEDRSFKARHRTHRTRFYPAS